jgi:hypothetical protein
MTGLRLYFILASITVAYWFTKAYHTEMKGIFKKMSQHFHRHLTHHQYYWWE